MVQALYERVKGILKLTCRGSVAMLCALFVKNLQIRRSMNNFEHLLNRLGERLPPMPAPEDLRIEPERIRQAAVALILRDAGNEPELLIIKRAERQGDPWSGHLALPGGRADATDTDLLATALRETREEIGVDLLDGGRVIGPLPLLAPNNPRLPRIEIMPFVAVAPPQFSLTPNEEVANLFWTSAPGLKRAGLSDEYRMTFGEIVSRWPAYPSSGGPIWGITQRILTDFLSHLD